MAKKYGKKYLAAAEKIDSAKLYTVEEAAQLVKDIDFAKFDATVEIAFNLNVDTRQADQQLRGAVVLPNGTGKDQTVVVFAQGDKAKEAEEAGADVVGAADLVQRNSERKLLACSTVNPRTSTTTADAADLNLSATSSTCCAFKAIVASLMVMFLLLRF